MKFTMTTGCLILFASIVSITNGNAQSEPRSQPSLQPTCTAVKLAERSTTSEQPITQRSNQQVQQNFECALNTQPHPAPVEPQLSERDRLIKERFEQRVIPPQAESGKEP